MTETNAPVIPATNLTQHDVYGPPNPRKPPPPLKHAWFDPWLIPNGDALEPLIREIADCVARQEVRQRRRRADDQHRHHRMLVGIACNLARAVLSPPQPTGWLAVNTRNGDRGKSRYDNAAFGTTFRDVTRLEAGGFLYHQQPAPMSGEVSSITPTSHFKTMVREAGIGLADFMPDPAQEVIYLFRKRHKGWEIGSGGKKERIDYDDTPVTNDYREAVQALNAFLAKADIAFLPDGLNPVVDPFHRSLRRHFTVFTGEKQRFDRTGRLYGGFWQLISRDRRSQIRINGEPIADVDFQSMGQRLAYLEIGEQPPDGDLYLVPPLENHRDGVKLAMNVLLFDTGASRKTWPPAMGMKPDETTGEIITPKLPSGWGVARTKNAILMKHPALAKAWGYGIGHRLMWRESEIMIRVLTSLMKQNVPALCLHDGLLVPVSQTEIALKAMRDCSWIEVGAELPCVVK